MNAKPTFLQSPVAKMPRIFFITIDKILNQIRLTLAAKIKSLITQHLNDPKDQVLPNKAKRISR